MKRLFFLTFCLLACFGSARAQVNITYDDEAEWKAYDDFNAALLDNSRNIYKADTKQPNADHRGNGYRDNDVSGCAAAIWCQAIMYDMVINAYNRAKAEGDDARMSKYKSLHDKIYKGEKAHYVNFDFNNSNTNNGWFVYDDIMWWTCALARAYETFGKTEYLNYSERSFCRVWYGSATVGDDGSYADPARFEGKYGGGMFWEWQPIAHANPHKPGDFRSACINFPTVIAACTLHKLVPEGREVPTAARPLRQTKEWYLEKAKEIYAWADATLVNSNGRVADGIHGGDPEFSDHLYNQATYIGASCLLYLLTDEVSYLTKAQRAANYVINNMCTSTILKYETGYEQGIYAAIYAQYIKMLVYDCGLSETLKKKYMTHIQRNIQRAYTNMDPVRGIQMGNFAKKTSETDVVESYGASGMPALMLMFPVIDSSTAIGKTAEKKYEGPSDVYTPEGMLVMKNATPEQVHELDSGLYIFQRKKILVK
ncbi:MAG: alpha-1,6-mannanase [Bacteroidaceae bacterium]|nr:alpha-1,6-mannanase [Bacteroidaceae bacterium]MBQ9169963.1 alpha-1,6-mannanase [Bacteroidaceae bacterium]MBQ9295119.1 alpha-1,6-mannanase [Bacteroidaceae bacterium]